MESDEAENAPPMVHLEGASTPAGSPPAPSALAECCAPARFFEAIVVNNADMIAVIDNRGEFEFVNDAVRRILGHDPGDLVGRSGFDFIHPEDVGLAAESLVSTVADGGVREPLVIRLSDVDGDWRPVEILTHNLIEDGDIRGLVITARDMAARRESEVTADENRDLFEQVFERAPIGMALVEPAGPVRRANSALAETLGLSIQDLVGRSLVGLAHRDDRQLAMQMAEEVLRGGEPPSQELRFVRGDGQLAWARATATMVHDENGEGLYAVVHIEDVTEETRLRQELHRAATHDPLTGALNRAGLDARYAMAVAESDGPSAFILVDLDRFKPVNDTYGHHVGDQLLQFVVGRLTRTVRGRASISRIGGDEFVVHVGDVRNAEDARVIGERIRNSLASPFVVAGHKVSVSGSIGVAFLAEPVPIEKALLSSDRASYGAKHGGGNGVVVVSVDNSDDDSRLPGWDRAVQVGPGVDLHGPGGSSGSGDVLGSASATGSADVAAPDEPGGSAPVPTTSG